MVRPKFLGWALILYAALWMAIHRGSLAWHVSQLPLLSLTDGARWTLFVSTNALVEFGAPLGYLACGTGLVRGRPWARRWALRTAGAAFLLVAAYYAVFIDILSAHISVWSIGWGFGFKETLHLVFWCAAYRAEPPAPPPAA
ncbi:MAG: hypothetical protein V3V62_03475 [bacterium]